MSLTKIPVVSIAALTQQQDRDTLKDSADTIATQRRALADQLVAICHDVGFFIVTDHGVPVELFDRVFGMMETLFALPEADKRRIDKNGSRHFRGWEPVGTERTNGRVDVREQVDVWTEQAPHPIDAQPPYLRLCGPNLWLPDHILPGHRDMSLAWFSALANVADVLLDAIGQGLGLEPGHLRRFFGADAMSLTKFISYPPTPEGAAGVNAHKDTGFLTVLAAGTTPGLQAMAPSGEWLDVPIVPHAFVINLGEMMQAITGGYLVATPHRVVAGQPRLSTAYFHGPSLDTALLPLPLAPRFADAVASSRRHAAPGWMATREEAAEGVGDMKSTQPARVYGEQLWRYFLRSYPDIAARHYADV
eukprot:m.187699 g.187699  ORF g.187699 m.187699 type:complete len:362 (-) comp17170_c0_seq1:2616-3701(-)